MPATIFVKPAPGLKIRLPENPAEVLPDHGVTVTATSFWLRRIAEGSVLQVEPEKAVEPAKKEKGGK
jgi:hypothetical protein